MIASEHLTGIRSVSVNKHMKLQLPSLVCTCIEGGCASVSAAVWAVVRLSVCGCV